MSDIAGVLDLDLDIDVNVTMGVDLMNISSPMMCPSHSSCGPLNLPVPLSPLTAAVPGAPRSETGRRRRRGAGEERRPRGLPHAALHRAVEAARDLPPERRDGEERTSGAGETVYLSWVVCPLVAAINEFFIFPMGPDIFKCLKRIL